MGWDWIMYKGLNTLISQEFLQLVSVGMPNYKKVPDMILIAGCWLLVAGFRQDYIRMGYVVNIKLSNFSPVTVIIFKMVKFDTKHCCLDLIKP